MDGSKGKKALSLCILRVLEKHATKEQPLTTRQIISLLDADFSMVAERKAVGRNLILLQEMGFELSTYQDNGKGYYLLSSQKSATDRSEYRALLLDALLRAPASEGALALIKGLQDPTAPIVAVPSVRRRLSAELPSILDSIKNAISNGVQITFLYNNLRTDGSLQPQRSTPYLASPYAIALADETYYVIMSISGYGKPLCYRCDLMSDISLTDTPVRSVTELQDCQDGLDVKSFIRRSLYQSNEADTHVLLCARHLIGALWDAFASTVTMDEEGDMVRACVVAPWSQVREFLLKNLKHAVLLAPEYRCTQLKDDLLATVSCYPNRQ
ncbi:MAG: WYL domain-containing protein [Eubacteriales bacterium]|nr:WYL domain-containing protein [Eubacteriales bacterium]